MSIPVGASGAQAEIPFSVWDGDGEPVEITDWSSHTVQVRLPGGTFSDATKANIVSYGPAGANHRGRYALQLTALESATAGQASIYVASGAGEFRPYWGDETIEPVAPSVSEIVAGVMAFGLGGARTVGGLLKKLYTRHFGKVTGMNSTTVTEYNADGSVMHTIAQDTLNGNRNAASVEE